MGQVLVGRREEKKKRRGGDARHRVGNGIMTGKEKSAQERVGLE